MTCSDRRVQVLVSLESRVCVGGLRYLCVCLVVLAVISGGIGTVRSCSRRCGAVSEGAGALGGDGGSWSAVDP